MEGLQVARALKSSHLPQQIIYLRITDEILVYVMAILKYTSIYNII